MIQGYDPAFPNSGISLLKINEAASFLRMSPDWMYQNKDKVGYVRIGGKIFFLQSALDKFIQSQTVDPENHQKEVLEKSSRILEITRRVKNEFRSQGKIGTRRGRKKKAA